MASASIIISRMVRLVYFPLEESLSLISALSPKMSFNLAMRSGSDGKINLNMRQDKLEHENAWPYMYFIEPLAQALNVFVFHIIEMLICLRRQAAKLT